MDVQNAWCSFAMRKFQIFSKIFRTQIAHGITTPGQFMEEINFVSAAQFGGLTRCELSFSIKLGRQSKLHGVGKFLR